jgi:Rrf2 family cysteine metabolism transcriptional repressor
MKKKSLSKGVFVLRLFVFLLTRECETCILYLIPMGDMVIKMKVSSKARYGIKALLDLAVHAKGDHVALKAIAERQGISDRYLEQVFSLLKKTGFVSSVKGPQGGYLLSCDVNRVTAYELIMALEGDESFQEEVNHTDVAQTVINEMLWQPTDEAVSRVLKSITLASMVNVYEEKLNAKNYMFFI